MVPRDDNFVSMRLTRQSSELRLDFVEGAMGRQVACVDQDVASWKDVSCVVGV